jgi:AraC family transcriptional regulator, ethanolamine operon transcriptional activator
MINIRRPGEPMDHRTSEDYRTTGLIVDAGFVQRVATSLLGVDAESILRGPVAKIDPRRCVSLDRSLRSALARLAHGKDACTSASQVQVFLTDWLAAAPGQLLPESWRESPSLGPQRRARVAIEAEDYMSTYLDRPMTLLEICEAIGVSERTLIYAFHERIGLSPKIYLKYLKLNRLRQDLKAVDPRTQSVHQVARTWGFEHSGALAADYRRLFGELPHETLRRRKL